MFWLEGLYRSRLLPVLICGIALVFVSIIPLAEQLPRSIQRTMTVLPFVKVSDDAAESARASSAWRVEMWQQVLPEIPPHLLLGKGYSIDATDLEKLRTPVVGNEGQEGAKLAGDYHNGPLSVIIPFGIGGVIGFLWLLGWESRCLIIISNMETRLFETSTLICWPHSSRKSSSS